MDKPDAVARTGAARTYAARTGAARTYAALSGAAMGFPRLWQNSTNV